ncbi:serine protease FAM111A-like [Megalobrama amblycephala]|uniref:serine protease FAM111A-like n=1 Tax=Megalobrama amblycephala TaxID=75352 RepID=UPI002013E61C|nr:serine protease FAM111A-like [Megalobrama amblycephala]
MFNNSDSDDSDETNYRRKPFISMFNNSDSDDSDETNYRRKPFISKKQTARNNESGETSQACDNAQTHRTAKNKPNIPPNKKWKPMDLLSPLQQSPKKQNARNNESGETSQASDNAQKTTAHSIKKEAEEEPSKDLQQEAEEKKHSFRFCLNSEIYSVACKTSMTVLEALNTSKMFRNKKNKNKNIQKEILIQRSKGEVPRAAVKTDFPCCLIEKDEILDITFIQKDENGSINQQTTADPSLLSKRSKPEALVTFWVKKDGGPSVKYLLKSKALRNRVCYVCVFAFKGEKVKTALKRDGRFKDVIFRKECGLSEFGMDTIHESSIPVEDLDRKSFQIVVISDNNLPDSQDDETHVKTEPNVASDSDVAEKAGPSQNPINIKQEKKDGSTTKSTNPSAKQYAAKPIDKSEEILGILRSQFKDLVETVKQRENLKNNSQVQTFFRAEYGKSVENFLEVKKVKKLMKHSDSVCQIRVGGSAIGTGFLLFDRFILTNAHVIGISNDQLRVNFAEYTAVFDYEDLDSQIKRITVKHLTAYFYGKDESGRHLDYALLELDEVDEIADCPELLSCYSPNIPNDRVQICIVGHPGEGVKKMDPCIIIEREKLQEAVDKHNSENANFIHVMKQQSLAEKWEPHDNQIHYDSCFFHGSSGSPVFDVDCKLIGVHTGGYVYKREKTKTWSIMEYAYSLQPILDHIKAQAKIKGLHYIVSILEPYTNKSNMIGAAEQENQTDIEMRSAESEES